MTPILSPIPSESHYRFKKQFDKAISEAEKAVALSPNSALAYFMLGAALYGSELIGYTLP